MKAFRKILVVGSGGREHALALRLLASESVIEVICTPGNAGMMGGPASVGGKCLRSVAGDPVTIANTEGVDLAVIGPEVALTEGIADSLRAAGIPCFGPSRAAAELEGSKAMMKEFCRRHGIRTARDVIVTRPEDLDAALLHFTSPPVVKADGLCAGKGVVVAESMAEARTAALEMLTGVSFGAAGTTVVLEERLFGQEASIHAICDGESAFLLPAAQDHKRIFDGDLGPNTGGMGTYAPAPVATESMLRVVKESVMDVVVRGMKAEGRPFIGVLFAGVMISDTNEAIVLEFNVRFGDPETQVLTQIVDGDFGEALLQAAQGHLQEGVLQVSDRHALCIVLAAENYPGTPTKGAAISGIGAAQNVAGVSVFHAGTEQSGGTLRTNGGRVLGVCAQGTSLREAHDRAYRAADMIEFSGKQMRRDIGHRALST